VVTQRLKVGDRVRFEPDEKTKPWIAQLDGGKVGVVRRIEDNDVAVVAFAHDNAISALEVHVSKLRRVEGEDA
jgi:hypothetical protein